METATAALACSAGCDGSGQSGKDYCYDPKHGPPGCRSAPVEPPTFASVDPSPTPPGTTYSSGEATVFGEGLLLSTGLTVRKIDTKNTKVQYDTGGQSTEPQPYRSPQTRMGLPRAPMFGPSV